MSPCVSGSQSWTHLKYYPGHTPEQSSLLVAVTQTLIVFKAPQGILVHTQGWEPPPSIMQNVTYIFLLEIVFFRFRSTACPYFLGFWWNLQIAPGKGGGAHINPKQGWAKVLACQELTDGFPGWGIFNIKMLPEKSPLPFLWEDSLLRPTLWGLGIKK